MGKNIVKAGGGRVKRKSLWQISLVYSPAHCGSLWLPLTSSRAFWLSQALCGSHWLPLANYCSLISLIQSLLGSQGPCSARSVATALQHFNQPCSGTSLHPCWTPFRIHLQSACPESGLRTSDTLCSYLNK